MVRLQSDLGEIYIYIDRIHYLKSRTSDSKWLQLVGTVVSKYLRFLLKIQQFRFVILLQLKQLKTNKREHMRTIVTRILTM